MANIITILILVLVLGSAIHYIIKSRKNGGKCIGCPSSGSCPSKNGVCDGSCNVKEK